MQLSRIKYHIQPLSANILQTNIIMTSSESLPEKITQLQCAECNIGLQTQFMQWISQSFKYKPAVLAAIQDQIQALLGYAQYKLTIACDKPQPGDFLQNIQFTALSKNMKIMWLLLSVVLPYVVKKVKAYAASQDSQLWKTIESSISNIQRGIAVLSFINYALFILKGQYRNLVQRVLGITMRFIDNDNKRILNFSLMNRILVWRIYEFFLKNILPHAFALFNGPLKNLFYLSSFLQPDSQQQSKGCIFCSNPAPTMPYEANPCLHKACYYCRIQNQPEKCPKCSHQIQGWRSVVK